ARTSEKENIILSVGRFFRGGHSKNQLEMVRAFRRLTASSHLADWRLVLIGTSNDDEYVRCVRREARGINVEIIPDASFSVIKEIYRKATIYWHASGLTSDPLTEPEKFEHFGMTVAEACANGCVPIVHYIGGPKEIVDIVGCGY